MLSIVKSRIEDLPRLMEIYRQGREIMISCGDVNQWGPGFPPESLIATDIQNGSNYSVLDDTGSIIGAFTLIFGSDPTYQKIYDGEWLDDVNPYATIHRLASTKDSKGVAEACFKWCDSMYGNLRVDTHEDNVIMRHCIEKAGFTYCGIIHLLNGDPRMAYQRIRSQAPDSL